MSFCRMREARNDERRHRIPRNAPILSGFSVVETVWCLQPDPAELRSLANRRCGPGTWLTIDQVRTCSCLEGALHLSPSGRDISGLECGPPYCHCPLPHRQCRQSVRTADRWAAGVHSAESIVQHFLTRTACGETCRNFSCDDSSTHTCWKACFRSTLLNTDPVSCSLKVVSVGSGYLSSLVIAFRRRKSPQTRQESSDFLTAWIDEAQFDSHRWIMLSRSHWRSCSSTCVFFSPWSFRQEVLP